MVDEQLAAALHAVHSNVSKVTGYSPGALAFHRDMFLDVPYVADLLSIRERRQMSVDANLKRVNARRSSYDCKIGDQVIKKRHEWSKLGSNCCLRSCRIGSRCSRSCSRSCYKGAAHARVARRVVHDKE